MFLSKDFCYLELHRRASIHISKLLQKYFPQGKQIGIHNRADKDIYNSNLFFLGSIRNPWDWYVSMWEKACEKRGELYKWTALKKFRFDRLGLKTRPFLSPYIFFNQFVKPFKKWNEVYTDPKNSNNFRLWLKLILKERIHDDGSGFGLSSIHNFSGQLTYRYLSLFSKRTDNLFNKSISNFDDIKHFDENYNVLNYVIKLENLENDFIKFLNKLNIKVDSNEEKLIKSLSRTNKSSRINNFIQYYDQECIDIIYQREKFIIDKYSYDLLTY